MNLVADAVSLRACGYPDTRIDLVFTAIDVYPTDGAITESEFAAAWMLDQSQACRRDDAHSARSARSGQGALKEKLAVAPVFSYKKYAHRLQQERRIWLRCR